MPSSCLFFVCMQSSMLPSSPTICFSNFEKDKKVGLYTITHQYQQLLVKIAQDLGGKVIEEVSNADVLVVARVGGSKFYSCLQLDIPIVVENWIYACQQKGTFLNPEEFKPPALYGLHICVTGKKITHGLCNNNLSYQVEERTKIDALCTENGAKFYKALTKDCTHLICEV